MGFKVGEGACEKAGYGRHHTFVGAWLVRMTTSKVLMFAPNLVSLRWPLRVHNGAALQTLFRVGQHRQATAPGSGAPVANNCASVEFIAILDRPGVWRQQLPGIALQTARRTVSKRHRLRRTMHIGLAGTSR